MNFYELCSCKAKNFLQKKESKFLIVEIFTREESEERLPYNMFGSLSQNLVEPWIATT